MAEQAAEVNNQIKRSRLQQFTVKCIEYIYYVVILFTLVINAIDIANLPNILKGKERLLNTKYLHTILRQ